MVLATRATSGSSVKLLSKAGTIITDRCSNLQPHVVEQLCLAKWPIDIAIFENIVESMWYQLSKKSDIDPSLLDNKSINIADCRTQTALGPLSFRSIIIDE